jgi:anaerobic magnesium-protoporphyrin IX monomethyl ester cyclase
MTAKPKILLINAPVLAVIEPWFDAPDFVRTSIAVLAGYLRKYTDYEITCLDAKFEKLNMQETVEKVKKINPDFVGFTAFTNEIKPSAYLAGLLKKELPDIITIIGGAHITAIPVSTLKEFPTFDYGIFGEGEMTLKELIDALVNKKTVTNIDGVVYRSQSAIVKNRERERIFEQDDLPMPAWDLLPPAKEYYIQTVRGCPFACVFCLNHNGKVARKRSAAITVAEMEWLIEYAKPQRISFGDELFSIDMKRTEELLDLMIERRIGEKVSWDIQTHVGYVNDLLFKKMKLANIAKCEMGVEAGDPIALKKMGKGTNMEMILKAFKSAHKYGIPTGSFLLLGQPNETHTSIWNTLKVGIKINPTEPIIGTMVPYPGTEVAKLAAKGEAGYKLITTNWDEYRKQLNGSLEFTNISRRALEFYQAFGYIIIFIANFRFLDFFRFLFKYMGGAIQLLRKMLSGNKGTAEMMNIPKDYDEIINSPGNISLEEIIDARAYWKKVQSDEIKRTKLMSPNLLLEQIPL